MLGDAVDRTRLSRSMSIFSLGATVGGALALGLGGLIAGYAAELGGVTLPLLGHFKSWQVVFLAIGSMGIPAVLLILTIREPARAARSAKSQALASDLSHVTRHWRFYLFQFGGFSLLCMLVAAVISWQPSFMLRTFGWDIRKVGGALGALHMIGGILGMLGAGILADHLQKRGYGDAHFRIYVFVLPFILMVGLATYWSGSLGVALIGIGVTGIVSPFIGVAASALALGTPPNRRGLTSAVFLFSYNLIGFGLGPMLAAWLAGRGSPDGDLGWALGLMFAIIIPPTIGIFWVGLRPMRQAVATVRALET
jgi:MFS family permease